MYSRPKACTNMKLDTLMSFESTLSDGVIHALGTLSDGVIHALGI